MQIIRREPLNDVVRMHRLLDRWFNDLDWPMGVKDAARSLPLDVVQTGNKLVVKAALPGVQDEDLDVNIQDGVLTIKAEIRQEELTESDKVYLRENFYGSLSRSLRLPENVDEDGAVATFDRGFLCVELPIVQPEEPAVKRLVVQSGKTKSLKTPAIESKVKEEIKA